MCSAIVLLLVLVVVSTVVACVFLPARGVIPPLPPMMPRDSELPTTKPADPDSPPDTAPGSVVWLRPEWVNTVPTRPAPLEQEPFPQPPKGGLP